MARPTHTADPGVSAFGSALPDAAPRSTSFVPAPLRARRAPAREAGAVLVLGNYRPALTAARRLSELGHRVVLGSEPGQSCAERSRFVEKVWRCPALVPGSEAFLAALLGLIRRMPDLHAVLPTTEPALNAIAAAEAELAPLVRLALPPAGIVSVLHDKHRSLCAARDAGLRVPAFAVADGPGDLESRVAAVGYPVVIRSTASGQRIGKQKAVMARDAAELSAALQPWPENLAPVLIQRRFTGARTNVYFAARDGRMLAEQHSLSLRTDRADGTGQTIEGVSIAPIESIGRDVRRLVAFLGYTGVGCAQFLYDEARDDACFLEINPRFGASYVFVERAGMDLTRLALDLAWNDPVEVPDRSTEFDVGTRFVWTYGDLSGLLHELGQGRLGGRQGLTWLGRALRAAVRSGVHLTWSWRDPAPTLLMYMGRFARPLRGG